MILQGLSTTSFYFCTVDRPLSVRKHGIRYSNSAKVNYPKSKSVEFWVGTMIEIPRAALMAGEIAKVPTASFYYQTASFYYSTASF